MIHSLPIDRMVMPPLKAVARQAGGAAETSLRPLLPRMPVVTAALLAPDRGDEPRRPAPRVAIRPGLDGSRRQAATASPPAPAPSAQRPDPPRRPSVPVVGPSELKRETVRPIARHRTPDARREPDRRPPPAERAEKPKPAAAARVTERVVERRIIREILRERPMVVRAAPAPQPAPTVEAQRPDRHTNARPPPGRPAPEPRPPASADRTAADRPRTPALPRVSKPWPEVTAPGRDTTRGGTVQAGDPAADSKPRPEPAAPPHPVAPAAKPPPVAPPRPLAPLAPAKPALPRPPARPPMHQTARPAPAPPPTPPRVRIEIGRIEIVSKPARPTAATPSRRIRRPRGHGIDPGLPFRIGRP